VPLDAVGARRFYDRIGRFQDTQRFYEDPAVDRLIEVGAFDQGAAVFELGCGTGRLAVDLVGSVLAPSATYVAVDVSPMMVRLATDRLAQWSKRVSVRLLEPPIVPLPGDDASFDRFLATYVFDLLSPEDAQVLIGEAGRLLTPGGLLALVSLTHGTTPISRIVCSTWNAIALRWPSLVGGCRSIELTDLISGPEWRLQHRDVVVRFGVPSEVVVARREDSPALDSDDG
jgi:ubiquinone/menaquinone biosynthesis C-methylase UbiE